MLDGTVFASPYLVEAIGDPATLASGLTIPGGTVDSLSALAGVTVTIGRQARLDLPALAHAPTFNVARPVGSSP
jgi:uncharacterized protein YlxW (UPF0749 family)